MDSYELVFTKLEKVQDLARRLALTLGCVTPSGDDWSKFNRHVLSLLSEAVDEFGITQEEADEFKRKMYETNDQPRP